jgi:hypothetical protein
LLGGEEGVLLGPFLGTGSFLSVGRRRPGGRRFEPAGSNGGPRLLTFEKSDLVAKFLDLLRQDLEALPRRISQLLNFLLQDLEALLLRVDEGQQRVHEGRSFASRD